MPPLGQSVPKYRKHKASGQAIVEINGRRYYLGPHGTQASHLEYDRLIGDWLASGRSPAFGKVEQVITLTELILSYLEHAKKYYGEGTRGEYANMLRTLRPVRQLYGRLPAREFGPLQLKAMREKFIANGNCRTYANQQVQRIVRMFRWAVAEGVIQPDLHQALAAVDGLRKGHTEARESEKVKPVSDALLKATLPHLSPIVRAMVELHRLCGCRPGELVLLRPCDIDRTHDIWEFRPTKHKNENREQDRCIYIGPKGQEILRPFLLRAADAYCFSPAESVAKQRADRGAARKTPLSYGNRPGTNVKRKPKRQPGQRYTSESYQYAIRRACEKAFPVPKEIAKDPEAVKKWHVEHHWSPNQLRHTAATEIRRRFGLEAAQVTLGHSQADVTQIYAQRDYELAVRIAREVG
jgi:integrase